MTSLEHAQSLPHLAFTSLHALTEIRVTSSVAENNRSEAAVLRSLVQQACDEANVALANVGMIAADTGPRANRVSELMTLASSAFPHLDETADVACVGIGSGNCGAVPYMTALVVAQQQAAMRGAPVLYVSNEEAHVRYAALIRPTVLHA